MMTAGTIEAVGNSMGTLAAQLALAKDASQVLALLVGAAWVLWTYFLGRTHVPRLQPDLNAQRVHVNEQHYLQVSLGLKNPGQTVVELVEEGMLLLEIFQPQRANVQRVAQPILQREVVFAVFEKIPQIEPGISYEEQRLIELPAEDAELPFRLTIVVVIIGRVCGVPLKLRRYRKSIVLPPIKLAIEASGNKQIGRRRCHVPSK